MPDQISTLDGAAAHVSYRQLEAFVENRLPADDRALVAAHVGMCPVCKHEVDDLALFRHDIKAPHIKFVTRGRLLAVGLTVIAAITGLGVISIATRPAEIPPEYAALVNQAVAQSYVQVPPEIVQLNRAVPGLKAGGYAPTFRLNGPLGTAVLSTKPEFSWEPLLEKAKYSVSIFDENHDRVDHSGPIAETNWRPTVHLKEGAIYEWQVRAETLSTAVVSPGPSSRPARFRVLNKQEAGPLNQIASKQRGNHLLLGVLYGKAGVLDEAELELSATGPIGAPILSYIRNLRK